MTFRVAVAFLCGLPLRSAAWQAPLRTYARATNVRAALIRMDVGNPYETLGVKRDATSTEIKKAFRDKAVKMHPDRSADLAAGSITPDEAQDRFQAVGEAYEILKDPAKRKEYDTFGSVGGQRGGYPGGPGGMDMEEFMREFMRQQGQESPQRPKPKPFPQPEMEGYVRADVDNILRASRASGISTDRDEARASFAGKPCTVSLVDRRDNSVKVRVMVSPGRAAELWYGAAALWDARVMKEGLEVHICADVEAIHSASRAAGIDVDKDSIRASGAGKDGVVRAVDLGDQTAKVRFLVDEGEAVICWFPIAAIEPKQRDP